MNCLDEPILIAVSKLLLTELGIHHRLEDNLSSIVVVSAIVVAAIAVVCYF